MIENIAIDRIIPHPNNPRKDLGDLTELAASIATSGIFQNLTVVKSVIKEDDSNWRNSEITAIRPPAERAGQGYTVIIGHRRLAAAKLAGLETVPCAVVEMDEKMQLSTMLLENMQRVDLTLIEQAQGIQLMLDLGETVASIAEQTGLSQTTIRSRKKIAALDQTKLQQAAERGATLSDYAELDKITDITLKNKVLESIGTHNFNFRLQDAIEREQADKMRSEVLAKIQEFAIEITTITDEDNVILYKSIRHKTTAYEDFESPEDSETVQYYYNLDNNGCIDLYVADWNEYDQKATAEIEQKQSEQAETHRREQLQELAKKCYNLRMAFARDFSGFHSSNRENIEKVAMPVFAQNLGQMDKQIFENFIGVENLPYDWELDNSDIPKEEQPPACRTGRESYASTQRRVLCLDNMSTMQLMFTVTYLRLENNKYMYFNYSYNHENNTKLNLLYELLCSLGYQVSDEELALQNGTHELFNTTSNREELTA